jgi:hypothetical protein
MTAWTTKQKKWNDLLIRKEMNMDSSDYKMDSFIEKLVTRKKQPIDYIQTAAVILLAFIILSAGFFVELPSIVSQFIIFIWAAVIYGVYLFIKSKSIEYEYAVTNGDMDIDRIIAKKKRKRIFSGNCRNYEIIARVHSDKYNGSYAAIEKKITAVSSMDSEDVYFLVTQFDSARTIVYFEPSEKMMKAFRIFISSKIYQ